jgi:hypothetical protein
LVAGAWVIGAFYAVWGPLPTSPVIENGALVTIQGCEHIVFDYSKCVAEQDARVGAIALVERGLIIISVPILLPLLILAACAIFDWVNEGYRASRNP